MTDYNELQKRCQRGATNLNDANNLLAECYGMLGKLGAEIEALRKRIEDLSPFKGAPLHGPDTECLACGRYHYGMSGLPCPNMRITAQAEHPSTRSGQIGSPLSKEG